MAGAATAERTTRDFNLGEQGMQQRPEETYGSLWDAEFTHRTAERKSFEPMASVRMLRYDLHRFGYVLPETREQVLNEEMSLIVEGVNRAARPTFCLKRQGDDLVYFKHGTWQSYTGMLITGNEVAKSEAAQDPRRQFLAEAAGKDLYNGYQMRKLKPGEQHVWYSDYRKDLEARYGKDFMRECGRFPDRQMGFLNRAYCNAEGDIILESQTVDRSNAAAFESAMRQGHSGANMDAMLQAYDETLKQIHGQDFYAGRLNAERDEDAWQTIQTHRDLMTFFMDRLEAIAADVLGDTATELAVKRHMYGVWAAFKRRLDGEASSPRSSRVWDAHTGYGGLVEQEVRRAFADFAEQGVPMIGCGGKIEMLKGEQNILNASVDNVFDGIFGNRTASDKFGSLTFDCPKGHTNHREPGRLLDNCKHCGIDVSCKEPAEGSSTSFYEYIAQLMRNIEAKRKENTESTLGKAATKQLHRAGFVLAA